MDTCALVADAANGRHSGTYLTFPSVLRRVRHKLLSEVISCDVDVGGSCATVLRLARQLGSQLAEPIAARVREIAAAMDRQVGHGPWGRRLAAHGLNEKVTPRPNIRLTAPNNCCRH
eukprot:COSAG01_NODE_536_length_15768_cov_58.648286_17_plen_117_part_00